MLGLGNGLTPSIEGEGRGAATGVPTGKNLWVTADLSDYSMSGDDTLALGSDATDGIDNYLIIAQRTDGENDNEPVMTLTSSSSSFTVDPAMFDSGRFTLSMKMLKPVDSEYDGVFFQFFDANTAVGSRLQATDALVEGEWVTLSTTAPANGNSLRFKVGIEDEGAGPATNEELYITDIKVSHSSGSILYRRGPAF